MIFPNSWLFFSQETSLHVQNMSQNPLEMRLSFGEQEIPSRVKLPAFQLVIFQEFSAAEQKRRANAESRSILRWRDGAMVNPKEMQNGIGEWMSTCFGIVDSYNLLYRCSFVFFAKLFYKRCWPILLFWGRGMTCFCASMTSWSQQQQWLLDPC